MRQADLLNDKILPSLTKLTIPIVLTAMMQMAYNMIDMLWIGKLGANSVAAIGVAGMFTWLSNGLVMMPRIGGQVKTGHSLGEKNREKAIIYESATFQIAIFFAFSFSILMLFSSPFLVSLFHLNNIDTINSAIGYMRICCGLVIFSFLNQIITGLFHACGDSQTPFLGNGLGLCINLILDPLLIFGIGIFPKMGVIGA
ncbi:MAG: MATE family efflux transporter, partial [Faecalibacillus sp.]